ncbi:unnamed protein product [Didymodactylos carnosus]|uniref:Ankyrin repeat domain-containing protein n=1 Tax=Didymodactylos carnosus TaxID=1234261 RepID=A0A813NNW5_9BILA|nr:unnamed protein product [Didymodactylos carnosus]CAF0739258.1 unnamed protein product [Didymodactylos carnosus]CAF3492545.1 unnamed protein product [Didymodactylos carnosus]CAF3517415.1 unnamed protein product [Didymodactylos carnosus]
MGFGVSKEQLISNAIENQDVSELRLQMKDLTPEQLRQIFIQSVPGEENQCTLLHYAAWQDNPDLLAPLLEYVTDLEIRDGFGWTPLMSAINRGSRENVKLLLGHGARIDCDFAKGLTLVADAMAFNDKGNIEQTSSYANSKYIFILELVSLLIENGAQVSNSRSESIVDGENSVDYPLLHYAVDDGQEEMVRILTEKGKAPLNTPDQSGWYPLHLASGHGYLEIVKLLVNKGADINVKDKDGNTPLAWARKMEAREVEAFLSSSGAVADDSWHGEEIKLKTYEEANEENTIDNVQQNGGENHVEKSSFEIEMESKSNSKRQPSTIDQEKFTSFDALQRKRNNPIVNEKKP